MGCVSANPDAYATYAQNPVNEATDRRQERIDAAVKKVLSVIDEVDEDIREEVIREVKLSINLG